MGVAPSVPSDRTRTLKVIGAGYSRTGTSSMAVALQKLLDGPVMHGGSQLMGREDAYVKLWSDVFAARHDKPRCLKLLREATAGFVALTDAPGICFMEELLELYPEAQVICVKRDPVKWWKSWQMMLEATGNGFTRVFMLPVPGRRFFSKLVDQFQVQQTERFGDMSERRMEEHNEFVKQVTPPENFHTMELSEGWAPLCRMLDMKVPDEPFPRVNDAEAVQELFGSMMREASMIWAGIFATAGAVGYGLYRLF